MLGVLARLAPARRDTARQKRCAINYIVKSYRQMFSGSQGSDSHHSIFNTVIRRLKQRDRSLQSCNITGKQVQPGFFDLTLDCG